MLQKRYYSFFFWQVHRSFSEWSDNCLLQLDTKYSAVKEAATTHNNFLVRLNQITDSRLVLMTIKYQQDSDPIAVSSEFFSVTNSFLASVSSHPKMLSGFRIFKSYLSIQLLTIYCIKILHCS